MVALKKITVYLFLICLGSYLGYVNFSRKTLLILHSYDTNYAWVRDLNIGIKRTLGNRKVIRILYHYMDTKNHPDLEFKQKAGVIARRVVDYIRPDVVLATDDDAQEFVMKHYKNNKNLQIVFAGMNAKPEQYGYDKATNVTGVLERVPYEAIKDVVQIIAAQRHLSPPYRVLHISDQSIIVGYDDINMHEYPHWGPLQLLKSQLVNTFDEWKEAIRKSEEIADIILISNYRKVYKDQTKRSFVPFKEVIEWSYKNAKIPLIGVNGFVCEEGAALAVATSPIEQGELGARIALTLLDGNTPIKNIPIQTPEYPMIYIHKERFKESGYILPEIYLAFAKATNNLLPLNQNFQQE